MYLEIYELLLIFAACLLVCLGIAYWCFCRWQYKDKCEGGIMMDEGGGVPKFADPSWEPLRRKLRREAKDQILSLSADNMGFIQEELDEYQGILGDRYDWEDVPQHIHKGGYGWCHLYDMQHFMRLLTILNLDIIIFRKKYKKEILKALKDAGASALCLAITIAHFAVVVCFVGVTFIPFVTLKAVPPMRHASKATMTAMRTFFASICW